MSTACDTITLTVNHKAQIITVYQFPGDFLAVACDLLGWQGGTVWDARMALKDRGWLIINKAK